MARIYQRDNVPSQAQVEKFSRLAGLRQGICRGNDVAGSGGEMGDVSGVGQEGTDLLGVIHAISDSLQCNSQAARCVAFESHQPPRGIIDGSIEGSGEPSGRIAILMAKSALFNSTAHRYARAIPPEPQKIVVIKNRKPSRPARH